MPNRSTPRPHSHAAWDTEVAFFIWLITPQSPDVEMNRTIAGSCVAIPPWNAASEIVPTGVHPIRPRPPVPTANGFHVDSPQIDAVAPAAAILFPPNTFLRR